MCRPECIQPFGRGDEAEEADARSASSPEASYGGDGASTGGQHRIEDQELPCRCAVGYAEVVINGFERVVIAVQADVAYARGGNDTEDAFEHAEPGAQNRNQHELLSLQARAGGWFERCTDGVRHESEISGGFVGHEHGNLTDQFTEELRRSRAIAQERELVLDEGMPDDGDVRICRGGEHGAESSIFAWMKEYQAVILRLGHRVREDEDAITDLLNERSRGGWQPVLLTQDSERITIVFAREAESAASR